MRAGKLRHLVVVEHQTTTEDEFGETLDRWCLLANRRASIEPINGREYMAQSGEHAEVTTRIRLRFDDMTGQIKPRDRVVYGGVNYDIISVINPMMRGKEITLMCRHGYDGACQ